MKDENHHAIDSFVSCRWTSLAASSNSPSAEWVAGIWDPSAPNVVFMNISFGAREQTRTSCGSMIIASLCSVILLMITTPLPAKAVTVVSEGSSLRTLVSPSPAPADARQLITVNTDSARSTVGSLSAWQQEADGSWTRVLGPVTANVGAAGVGQASEGSTRTPAGTFGLTEAFGRLGNPGTSMPYFKTDYLDWWDGKSNSPTYNTHIRQASNPGQSENLYGAGAVYDYAINMGYNLGRTPGAGSAFFLHITDGTATAGCVAIDRQSIITLLKWLQPSQNPYIDVRVGAAWTPDPPESNNNPKGDLNDASPSGSGNAVVLNGWAFDPDAPNQPVQVHVYDYRPDGTSVGIPAAANTYRPDVDAAFGVGSQHGFEIAITLVGTGRHRLCVYAINLGRGTTNPQIGCREVAVAPPTGALDSVVSSAPGQLTVAGWAADPSAPNTAESVHVYVTGPRGTLGTSIRTGLARGDVARSLSWAGPNTGFKSSVSTMGEGSNRVCVYAIGINTPAAHTLLGCENIMIANAFGAVDSAVVSSAGVTVAGWALNPNLPAQRVSIHVYDTGPQGTNGYSGFLADTPRSDVARAKPGYDGQHGFTLTIPRTGAGSHRVCVYAITTNGGAGNALLGCREVTVK